MICVLTLIVKVLMLNIKRNKLNQEFICKGAN